MQVYVGDITCPELAGPPATSYAIGFRPSALLFFGGATTGSNAWEEGGYAMMGAATHSGTGYQMWAVNHYHRADALDARSSINTGNCIWQYFQTEAEFTDLRMTAEFYGFTDTGFSLVWNNVVPGRKVHVLALGGVEAKAGYINFASGDVSGDVALPFEAKTVITSNWFGPAGANPLNNGYKYFGYGFSTGLNSQLSKAIEIKQGGTDGASRSLMSENIHHAQSMFSIDFANTTLQSVYGTPDGFHWDSQGTFSSSMFYLALGGSGLGVASGLTSINSISWTISTPGFTPKVVLQSYTGEDETPPWGHANIAFGAGYIGTARGYAYDASYGDTVAPFAYSLSRTDGVPLGATSNYYPNVYKANVTSMLPGSVQITRDGPIGFYGYLQYLVLGDSEVARRQQKLPFVEFPA